MINHFLYPMIFKRKSFHVFKDIDVISESVIKELFSFLENVEVLEPTIKVKYKLEKKSNPRRGEYGLLIFSEKKDNYLQNVGYIGQQIDLWCASKDIGVCWYGLGRPDVKNFEGLDYVIMLNLGKVKTSDFRKDMFKSKRKELNEIWNGPVLEGISEIVRFAPSACNTQPWLVENNSEELLVYRVKGKRGIMPLNKVSYYNCIDIGIFMCILELTLIENGYQFDRTLFVDNESSDSKVLNGLYRLRKTL